MAPPPRPELCGSTRPSIACTATAASIALPPRRSTAVPASTASGCAATTMPDVAVAVAVAVADAGATTGAGDVLRHAGSTSSMHNTVDDTHRCARDDAARRPERKTGLMLPA